MFPFHWYLGIQTKQIMLRGGDFVSFLDPGARDLHWKAVPGAEILTEKIVAWGGIATSQIDA